MENIKAIQKKLNKQIKDRLNEEIIILEKINNVFILSIKVQIKVNDYSWKVEVSGLPSDNLDNIEGLADALHKTFSEKFKASFFENGF